MELLLRQQLADWGDNAGIAEFPVRREGRRSAADQQHGNTSAKL